MNFVSDPISAENAILADPLRAERQDFDRIPVVDLSGFRQGLSIDRTVREIKWALTNVGFLYVSGHGVPAAVTSRAYTAARSFFAQPHEVKQSVALASSGRALRGYTAIFGENTNPGVTKDFKECFDAGPDRPDRAGHWFEGETPWPAIAGFKPYVSAYLEAMHGLADVFLEAVSLSLDLPRDFFARLRRQPIMIQRLLYYPSQTGIVDESVIGIGAHTDYGLMTILAQDHIGGLQVLNRSGTWVEAPSIPDTFVINIGDLMQRLTNDVYLANLHRVVNISGTDRYSMPCFVDADPETVIAPLSNFVSKERPAAYQPTTVLAHKTARYEASFDELGDDRG